MNKKKVAIIACIFIIFFGIIIAHILHAKHLAEEKKVGCTLYDVGAKKTTIEYNDKIINLTDEKRKEFIDVMKDVSQGEKVEVDENIRYDMTVDFNNGYSGKFSTDKKIFLLYDDVKLLNCYTVSEENSKKILEFIN
ncbi:hypothetical protein [Eubacterium sp.]|uniref:hypothetical protein n=1 Tax=Eubacterium sp. TaxID=142586 RepID=UPI0025D89409|nr:hypothetical protein [Eubacterium sp.]MCR5629350.1 hypothetical protein [Eubacterium sp.]